MRRPLIVIAMLAAVAALYWRFPYALHSEGDKRYLIYMVLWLIVMVSTSRMSRERMPRFTRDALIWTAVMISLVFGYSFRDAPVIRRLMGEVMPSQVQEQGDGSIIVHAGQNGHFFIEATVNDALVRFMVDTGASDIVLSPDDAKRANIDMSKLTYDRESSTANGYGSSAAVTLDHLAIGSLHMSHLSASVNKADMEESLLGMSFLKRLQSFRVEGNTLVLIP